MDWNNRETNDVEETRHRMAVIVWVAAAIALGCGVGVYFGLFIGMRLYGG